MTWLVVMVCLSVNGAPAECQYCRSAHVMPLEECEGQIGAQLARFRHAARQLGGVGIVDGFCDPASELL